MNGIYERIANWLLECPEMEGYVYFNVIPLEENTVSVNSNSGSSTINKYIDGSTEVHLLFNINLVILFFVIFYFNSWNHNAYIIIV